MPEEKRKNCRTGIYGAAIDGVSPDVFDPPLNEEQLELYYDIVEMCKELDATGEDYVIEIPFDD